MTPITITEDEYLELLEYKKAYQNNNIIHIHRSLYESEQLFSLSNEKTIEHLAKELNRLYSEYDTLKNKSILKRTR